MAHLSDYKFRLLLLYHDPLLCRFLESNRVLEKWLCSRLVAHCSSSVADRIRGNEAQRDDPFHVFHVFLSLVVLLASRDRLLCSDRACQSMLSLPSELSDSDVADMCQLAEHFELSTPLSFSMLSVKSEVLCMRVDVQELIETYRQRNRTFFLIDCRSQEQYNAGHLPTAYHLDYNLLLSEPAELSCALCDLLRAQQLAVANDKCKHLLLIGSARNNAVDMMSAALLNVNARYVSVLRGGYAAVHRHCPDRLVDHDETMCEVCSSGAKEKTAALLQTIGAQINSFKAKINSLTDSMSSVHLHSNFKPSSTTSESDPTDFLTPPMFSIADESDPEDEMIEKSQFPLLFTGCAINRHHGDIALTESSIVFLRDVAGWLGFSRVVRRREYSDIERINFSKKRPESVAFKYKCGHPMKDKIVLANSLDVVRLIQYILEFSNQGKQSLIF